MGKKIKKTKGQHNATVALCPCCGNEIPKYLKYGFKCKYCHYYITPEENNVKELWKNVES